MSSVFCAAAMKSASACAMSSAGWPPSVSVRISIWRPSRAARPCARASRPGSPGAPAGSRRRRACGGWARSPAPPRRRTASRARRRRVRTFIVAEAGQRREAGAQVGAVARLRPDPRGVAVVLLDDVAASSWTRRAIEPGKRWTAGFSLKTGSRSVCASVFGSSVPTRCLIRSGPRNACCTVICWSSAKPTRKANGSVARRRLASSSSVK